MGRMTPAGPGLWLLESSMHGDAPKRGGMEYEIAKIPGLRDHIYNAYARPARERAVAKLALAKNRLGKAEAELMSKRVSINLLPGRIDWYLILNDALSGTPGAMSIEYGRSPYKSKLPDGTEVTIGGMEGLGVLHAGFKKKPGQIGFGGGEILV